MLQDKTVPQVGVIAFVAETGPKTIRSPLPGEDSKALPELAEEGNAELTGVGGAIR